MTKETKNTISHRLRALDQFKIYINENPDLLLGDIVPVGQDDPEWELLDIDEVIEQQQVQ